MVKYLIKHTNRRLFMKRSSFDKYGQLCRKVQGLPLAEYLLYPLDIEISQKLISFSKIANQSQERVVDRCE